MSNAIGISDINLYVPRPKLDLDLLIDERIRWNPRLARHLDRARTVTGQKAIRYPDLWEDTSTLAASAAFGLLQRNRSRLSSLRYLSVGTETGVDHSKPVSSYVEGMLQKSGLDIPDSLTNFQVQHACAGGTLALMSVGALLSLSQQQDSGLVICSDIARYKTESTAEVTQGAGAAALLVEKNPRLLELDLSTQGYCSQDVDDFFRPLGSKIAQVHGRYSMECYLDNLEHAFLDHCRRRDVEPAQLLTSTDYFVLHAPFRNMPEQALQKLLQQHLGLVNGQTEAFMQAHSLSSAIDPVAEIGNTYSASMYIALAFLLHERYRSLHEEIVGKTFLLASYGSGNTMIVLSGRVAADAPAVIGNWDLQALLDAGQSSSMKDYLRWSSGPYEGNEYNSLLHNSTIPAKSFYLSGIREDGYREYEFNTEAVQPRYRELAESEASGDLYQPLPIRG
jgi:hydroxymethylglutaryl-CoA synthase